MEVNEILNEFYANRRPRRGQGYILDFLEVVSRNNIPVSEYASFHSKYQNQFGRGLKKSTRDTYASILNQFISFLNVKYPPSDSINPSKPKLKRTITIHNNLDEFQRKQKN